MTSKAATAAYQRRRRRRRPFRRRRRRARRQSTISCLSFRRHAVFSSLQARRRHAMPHRLYRTLYHHQPTRNQRDVSDLSDVNAAGACYPHHHLALDDHLSQAISGIADRQRERELHNKMHSRRKRRYNLVYQATARHGDE